MKKQPSTGIVPFTYFLDRQTPAGSTFLRAEGLANNSPDFKMWQHGHRYDQLIFQKAYWPEMMELFKGPKILDLCDPDWLYSEMDIIETGNLVDVITCSSEKLTHLVASYFSDKKVHHVPDRLDFNKFPEPKPAHKDRAKKIVWFGFMKNAYETLSILAPSIKKHKLQLTIIAETPYNQDDEVRELNATFIKYDQSTVYSQIKQADIVLNPKSERATFKYKSNNKSIISWKLGVPVAERVCDLELLLDPTERNKQVVEMQDLVNGEYNILKSAEQYRDLFYKIRHNML